MSPASGTWQLVTQLSSVTSQPGTAAARAALLRNLRYVLSAGPFFSSLNRCPTLIILSGVQDQKYATGFWDSGRLSCYISLSRLNWDCSNLRQF